MNEFLTIGQLEVTGSNAVRAGASREIQPHARLEMMHELLTRCASCHPKTSRKSGFLSNFLMVPHHGIQQPELREAREGLYVQESKRSDSLFEFLKSGMSFRSSEQLFLVHYSGHVSFRGEVTTFPARLLHDRYSSRQMGWHSKSISDWADTWGVLTTVALSHPSEDHLSGLVRASKIASFIGRIAAISGDVAYVTLFDESTGERFEAECESAFLRQRGIQDGAEFLCTVTRKDEQTVVEFSPVTPKVLTEEELEEISREVDSRLK